MKFLLTRLFAAFILGVSTLAGAQTTDASRYSLKTTEQLPIPKREFFALWTDVALKACEAARQEKNLLPEQCREKVRQRSASCELKAGKDAPDRIGSRTLTRELGRQYLDCVTPYYYCNGVEVKTVDEVRQKCGASAANAERSDSLPPGYIKQGNLVWTPKIAFYPYLKAKELCSGTHIRMGGWRLPSKDELLVLQKSGLAKAALWGTGYFWSMTHDVKEWHHVTVSLSNGNVMTLFDPNVAEVTCVRMQ